MNDIEDQIEKFLEDNDCLIYGEILSTHDFARLMKNAQKREEFMNIIEQIPCTE